MNFLKNLYAILDRKQKRTFFVLQLLIILTVFFEILGVSLILPFTSLVGDPLILEQNNILADIYKFSEIQNPNEFILYSGISVLVFLFLGAVIGILTTWRVSIFAAGIGVNMGTKLYQYYIRQDWTFFLQNNSSELVRKISTECQRLIDGILIPIMQINSRIALVLAIIVLLIVVNPFIALTGFLIFSFVYMLIFSSVRSIVFKNGNIISEKFSARYKLMLEGFGGIKDLILLGRFNFFYNQFKESGDELAKKIGTNQALQNSPRYLVEFLAFSAIIFLILYLAAVHSNNLAVMLPIISLYAVAGLKLLPSLQGIYGGLASISGNMAAFNAIKDDLIAAGNLGSYIDSSDTPKLLLNSDINFQNVSFSYPAQTDLVLNDFSLSIPANKLIGIVGPTGSGKSTIVDLILGLLSPNSGTITIDNKELNNINKRSWQNNIGYVPQSIFLSDSTILENIAFGIKLGDIDKARVKRCASLAKIDNYIDELSDGYYSMVGERGVQMSGGQRQRISIARALYHNPSLLVLDEATSALDGITEKQVIESIIGLAGSKTILMIAHKLQTVKNCDIIYFIQNGELSASGTFDGLLENNQDFQNFVNARWVSK